MPPQTSATFKRGKVRLISVVAEVRQLFSPRTFFTFRFFKILNWEARIEGIFFW